MKLHKAPETVDFNKPSIFLAGSIDMGNSKNWQTIATQYFKNKDVLVLNPRREAWDSSWKQSITNPQFKEQVEWELNCLDKCTKILMHFEETSQSPITLLELGLLANSGKIIISCPEKFWRRGNVEIVANRYNIPLFFSLEDSLSYFDLIDL